MIGPVHLTRGVRRCDPEKLWIPLSMSYLVGVITFHKIVPSTIKHLLRFIQRWCRGQLLPKWWGFKSMYTSQITYKMQSKLCIWMTKKTAIESLCSFRVYLKIQMISDISIRLVQYFWVVFKIILELHVQKSIGSQIRQVIKDYREQLRQITQRMNSGQIVAVLFFNNNG